MSFFKKIGKFIKKNVNLRNTLNVVKYAANVIPGVGTAIGAGISAAQGVYDEAQARKEQERMEAEARSQMQSQVEMINNAVSKPNMSARSSASLSVSNQDLKDVENYKNNNNKNNNNKEMTFFENLEAKTFKGARYVLFALPVLIFLFKDKIFGKRRGR